MATTDADTDIPVLAPNGDLDLHSARDLGVRLSELAGERSRDVVLDLTRIAFMDSTGLGVVLKGANRFARQDKRLVIAVAPGNVRRIFEFAGVAGRLCLVETREAALALAASPPR